MVVIKENCCHWKSTSGLDGKRLFAHIVRTNRRIYEIQTAYVQVWSKRRWKNVVAENLLPVSTGKRFFANILRTNRRIFEIQTAYVQVWSKWWWKNVVTKNLLPVSAGKDFLMISWELIDRFSKFKRHMFRFDRSDDLTFWILEIYFRCEQKNLKWALKHHFWAYFRSGLNG